MSILFIESRWTGAQLHELVAKELAPFRKGDGTRIAIEGPALVLETSIAQTTALVFHELATNAGKYGALSVSKAELTFLGPIQKLDDSSFTGPKLLALPYHDPIETVLAQG